MYIRQVYISEADTIEHYICINIHLLQVERSKLPTFLCLLILTIIFIFSTCTPIRYRFYTGNYFIQDKCRRGNGQLPCKGTGKTFSPVSR